MISNRREKTTRFEDHNPNKELKVLIGVHWDSDKGCSEDKGIFSGLREDEKLICVIPRLLPRRLEPRAYYRQRLRSSDIVEVHLDLIKGHLSFSVNGEYLGVAFDGQPCRGVHRLMVSVAKFDTEISIGANLKVLREWRQ